MARSMISGFLKKVRHVGQRSVVEWIYGYKEITK
jgi:hypothetical protein